MCDYRLGLDWWLDLLTAYTHDSELQAITASPLIPTIHKAPQHPLNLFPIYCVFTSCSLTTASNSGDSSASRFLVHLHSLPCRTVVIVNSLCSLLITFRDGPRRKHRSSVVAFVSFAERTCLQSCCPENTVLLVLRAFMLRALPRNARCLHSYRLAIGPYPTVRSSINVKF
jgi:hypothetical protein